MTRSAEDRTTAEALLRGGSSVREAAEHLGLPVSTVGVWRKAMAEPQSPGADATDKPKKPAQSDLPTNAPPNDDAEAIAKAEDQAAGQVDELVEPPAPPIMDRFKAEAWKRYLNLLVNDVAHSHALEAATKIDEDFHVGDDHARRILHALGKGEEPIRFGGNWSAGTVQPPSYVTDIFGEFEMTDEQIAELADYLYQIARESYLEGINAQLIRLGQPIKGSVTDQNVLASLREQANSIADGIAGTFNKDLSSEVVTRWIELAAQRGTQMSRQWLAEAIDQWGRQRAEWKAEQIAITEVGRFWINGTKDFWGRNQASGTVMVQRFWVTPDECSCDFCFGLVGDNPYTPEEAQTLNLPAHVRCIHDLIADAEMADGADAIDLWAAQSDGSLDEAV